MNVIQYFDKNKFTESLVIEYIYNSTKKKIVLVCDYAHDILTSLLAGDAKKQLEFEGLPYDKDIRMLIFEHVISYAWEQGSNKNFPKFYEKITLRDQSRAVVVHQLNIVRDQGLTYFNAIIDFGDVGVCKFMFKNAYVEQKFLININKVKNEWRYVDILSNQPIDYAFPFALPSELYD